VELHWNCNIPFKKCCSKPMCADSLHLWPLFLGGIRIWTQGFVLARQVLYHFCQTPSPFCFRYIFLVIWFLFPSLLCWVWVHCVIYKSSYNVSITSYLNSPCLSFILLLWFLEQFQQASLLHLHTGIHIFCTIFTLLPLFQPPTPLPPQDLFHPPVFSDFVEEKR
jgi:hypothetical protein